MMSKISIPFDQLVFGNPQWDTPLAIDEIMVYSDLIAHIDRQREQLNIRHEDEEVTLLNVQAVLMAYALEIGLKSLWSMDNPDKRMCHTHNLLYFYKGLQSDSLASLHDLGLTEESLKRFPNPFETNRYSMEYKKWEKYKKEKVRVKASFLKQLGELLRETLKKRRAELGCPIVFE